MRVMHSQCRVSILLVVLITSQAVPRDDGDGAAAKPSASATAAAAAAAAAAASCCDCSCSCFSLQTAFFVFSVKPLSSLVPLLCLVPAGRN